MQDLFSALHKYPPSENQITEMLAQVLRHEPSLLKRFFNLDIVGEPVVQTQVMVRTGGVAKWIDLAIYEKHSDKHELLAVVEIKWWSGLNYSPDEEGILEPQTKFYQEFIHDRRRQLNDDSLTGRMFYLTRIKDDVPSGWVGIRWVDVYTCMQLHLQESTGNVSEIGSFLVQQFSEFLAQQSVPEIEVKMDDILKLPQAVSSLREGYRLVSEINKQFSHDNNDNRWSYLQRDWNGTISSQLFGLNRICLVVNANPAPLQIMYAISLPDKSLPEAMARVWVECNPNRFKINIHGKFVLSIHEQLRKANNDWILFQEPKPDDWALTMVEKPITGFNNTRNDTQELKAFFMHNLKLLYDNWIDADQYA